MLNTENARSQNRLHYLAGNDESDTENLNTEPKTNEEMDFIFSKDEMKSIAKAEKSILNKKDTTLTSCIGSLLAHAILISKMLGLSTIHKELSDIGQPSADGITNIIFEQNVFNLSLEVINHGELESLITLLESHLLICDCLNLSYVTDRKKTRDSLLNLEVNNKPSF